MRHARINGIICEIDFSQWVLDRCSKYIDGVIYNLELSIKEEQAEILQS